MSVKVKVPRAGQGTQNHSHEEKETAKMGKIGPRPMTGLMIDDTNELERRVQCGVAWIRYFRLHELFFFCTYIFHPATEPAKGNIGCNIATSERITQPRGKRVGSQEAGESQVLGSAAVISSHFYPYLPSLPIIIFPSSLYANSFSSLLCYTSERQPKGFLVAASP